jgi:hypothetical protein
MVLGIIYLLILYGCIEMLQRTEKPLMCAAIYTVCASLLSLLIAPWLNVLISVPIVFLYMWGYFWLLRRYIGNTLFWVIAVGGALLPVVVLAVLHKMMG